MNEENDFLGRGWAFPPAFIKATDAWGSVKESYVQMVAAKEDIAQSLEILLSTSFGERVMQPQFGCNLADYQFESMSNTLIGFVKDTVENAILYYEPRIEMESITVSQADSWDAIQGFLRIDISYRILTTNSRSNFVYDFYLKDMQPNEVKTGSSTL